MPDRIALPGVQASVRQLRRWGGRIFDTFFCSLEPEIMAFGKDSSWHVYTGRLDRSSRVVSAGVGKDVSFELELVARYGCTVLLLDPSPTGVATMARAENHLPQIEFLAVGLAGSDGQRAFAPPADPEEGSYRVAGDRADEGVVFACRSLSSLARERGFRHIDLLKLDIEGFEYEVLRDLLRSGPPVGQLCVEFHHSMPDIPVTRTVSAVLALHRAGFRWLHKQGADWTFIRP